MKKRVRYFFYQSLKTRFNSSFEISLFSITIFFTRQLNLPSYSISCIKSKLFSLSTMSTMSNCLGTKATTRFLSETTFQQQRTAKNRKVLSSGESLFSFCLPFFFPSPFMPHLYPQIFDSCSQPISKQTWDSCKE